MLISNTNQARYNIATGIILKGFAISNRILKTIYTYGGYTLTVNPSGTMTFTIDSYKITNTRIPKADYTEYLFSVTIPSGGTSVDVDAGGVIDITFPANYVLENWCEN